MVLGNAPSFGNGTGLRVHVRTTRRFDFSYIESAALQIGDEVFQVNSFGEYLLNGVDSAELPATIAGYKISVAVENKKHHVFTIQIGEDSQIKMGSFKDLVRVDWDISGEEQDQFRDVSGLMGAWNTGTHYTRDGKKVLEMPDDIGQEWQVRDEDGQLFDIAREPQWPRQCHIPMSGAPHINVE